MAIGIGLEAMNCMGSFAAPMYTSFEGVSRNMSEVDDCGKVGVGVLSIEFDCRKTLGTMIKGAAAISESSSLHWVFQVWQNSG